ncbi:hypothetical protein [Sorangium sp. So ce341]|uniref:hypothetical protein n=1 Tax=Sorangium sp. So ce341 TaxID=3133302 RepID=UPI003F5E21D3
MNDFLFENEQTTAVAVLGRAASQARRGFEHRNSSVRARVHHGDRRSAPLDGAEALTALRADVSSRSSTVKDPSLRLMLLDTGQTSSSDARFRSSGA